MKLMKELIEDISREIQEYIQYKGGVGNIKCEMKESIKGLRALLDEITREDFGFEQVPGLRRRIYTFVDDMSDTIWAMMGINRDGSLRQRALRVFKLKKYAEDEIKLDALREAAQEIARLKSAGGGDWYAAHEKLRAKVETVDKQMSLMSAQYKSMQGMFAQVVERNQKLQAENSDLKRELAELKAAKQKDEATIKKLQAKVEELEKDKPSAGASFVACPLDDLVHGAAASGQGGHATVASH